MDEAQARMELKRPLVFGDARQIEAVRFLDDLALAIEAIERCDECPNCVRGTIYSPRDTNWIDHCSYCRGLGHMAFNEIARLTVDKKLKDEVIDAAMKKIRDANLKAALQEKLGR